MVKIVILRRNAQSNLKVISNKLNQQLKRKHIRTLPNNIVISFYSLPHCEIKYGIV